MSWSVWLAQAQGGQLPPLTSSQPSSRASRQESEVTWSQELELSSGVLALGKDILGAS